MPSLSEINEHRSVCSLHLLMSPRSMLGGKVRVRVKEAVGGFLYPATSASVEVGCLFLSRSRRARAADLKKLESMVIVLLNAIAPVPASQCSGRFLRDQRVEANWSLGTSCRSSLGLVGEADGHMVHGLATELTCLWSHHIGRKAGFCVLKTTQPVDDEASRTTLQADQRVTPSSISPTLRPRS
jgi:hypothetical protein